MGGEVFSSLVPGPELGPFGHLRMVSLYYDPAAPTGTGQWFAQFECSGQESTMAKGGDDE
jgi:hypothetical protein